MEFIIRCLECGSKLTGKWTFDIPEPVVEVFPCTKCVNCNEE